MSTAPYPVYFSHPGYQVLSFLIYFLGSTIIAHFISRRVQHEVLTFSGVKSIPWPRLCVILMFFDAWLFLLSSGILVFGIGVEYSRPVCTASIYLSILFYTSSKFFVYAFLAEKAHIVWSPTVGVRRFESPVYLVCMVSVSFYCIVMTLMLGGPIHETAPDGTCVIGLKPFGYIPLLVYDVYISLFLTFMFLFPLLRSQLMSSSIRRLAVRTLIATGVAILTSTTNVVVLMVLEGRETSWVFMAVAASDILVNATAIFWVSGSRSNNPPSSSLSNVHVDRNYRPSPHFGPGTSSKSHHREETSTSSNVTQFPIHLEGDVNSGPDSMHPANSWIHRLFVRDKPVRTPPVQIAVTQEFEHRNSQIEIPDRHSSTFSQNDDTVYVVGP